MPFDVLLEQPLTRRLLFDLHPFCSVDRQDAHERHFIERRAEVIDHVLDGLVAHFGAVHGDQHTLAVSPNFATRTLEPGPGKARISTVFHDEHDERDRPDHGSYQQPAKRVSSPSAGKVRRQRSEDQVEPQPDGQEEYERHLLPPLLSITLTTYLKTPPSD